MSAIQTNTNTAKPNNFINSIDFLRAIAAVAVCIFHLANGYLHAGNPIFDIFKEGHLGVEVFFVITGFLVPYSLFRKGYEMTKGFWQYMLDRVLRLHPAYLAAVAICILQEYIGTFFGRSFWVQWQDVFWHLFYLPPYVGRPWLLILFWTLAIQFQFYILFGLLYYFFMHPQKYVRILVIVTFMALNFFLDDLKYNNYLPYYMVIFIPGILLFQKQQGLWTTWEFWLLLAIDCYILYDQRFESLLRPAAVLFAICIILYTNINQPIWKWLGMISYALYLIHLPVGWSFMAVIQRYTQSELYLSLALLIAVGISIGLAYLFYLFIEKPSQEWAKQILKRWNGT
jgi:peptidoglycan/LPS O-acetylase OafA/YrhL